LRKIQIFIVTDCFLGCLMTLFEVQKFKCYGKMMMDGECVRMWKVFIVTHLKVLFWHLPTDT